MRRTNRWTAVAIVGSAVVAACVGSLSLSSVQQASLSITPNPVEFGDVLVGAVSPSVTIFLGPLTQNDHDRIESIEKAGTGCNDFKLAVEKPLPADVLCEANGVSPGGSGDGSCVPRKFEFSVGFEPTIKGAAECQVSINYSSSGSTSVGSGTSALGPGDSTLSNIETITLRGKGIAPPVALHAPMSISFGDVPVTQPSSPQTVFIRNIGSQPVTLNVNSGGSPFFAVGLEGAMLGNQVVPVDGVVKYQLTCVQPALNANIGKIIITPMEDPSLVQQVALDCNGINSTLAVSPSPASFAVDTLVGRPPDVLDVVISNLQPGTVTVSSVTLAAGARELTLMNDIPLTTLAQGQSVTQTISYGAATEFPYGQLGTLVIDENGTLRSVSVNGEALPGAIAASPATVAFGPVCAGVDVTRDVSIYTTAAGPVQIDALEMPAMPFATIPMTFPQRLEPNHGSVLMVTATVNATTVGDVSSVLRVDTNIPGAAEMLDIPVSATVLPAGVSPTPDVLHFGPGRVGSLTTAKSVLISNCSASDLGVTAVAVEGDTASDFQIVTTVDLTGQTIPQKGSLPITLVMNPQSQGTKVARLVVTLSDGSIAAVDLDGNGFTGEASDGDAELGTYYTCSASHGAASGVMPLALALLRLRRRRSR